MSVWIKCEDKMPPLNEEVLILYKDKTDELSQDNLFYGLAKRYIHKPFPSSEGWEDWSSFTEYQGYYEVVYWTPLIDMPRIDVDANKIAHINAKVTDVLYDGVSMMDSDDKESEE